MKPNECRTTYSTFKNMAQMEKYYLRELSTLKAKMGRLVDLLRMIERHHLARNFYKGPFMPPCRNTDGPTYDHMDRKNPLKCMFSAHQGGRDWGGLCPGHQKLFDKYLTHHSQENKE